MTHGRESAAHLLVQPLFAAQSAAHLLVPRLLRRSLLDAHTRHAACAQPDGSTDYIVGMDFSVAGTCSEVVKAKVKVVATAKACVNFGWEVCLVDARKNDWVYFHMAPKVCPRMLNS